MSDSDVVSVSLRSALTSFDGRALIEVHETIKALTSLQRSAILCSSDCVGQAGGDGAWGLCFLGALHQMDDKELVFEVLQELTDVRPPPLRDTLAHFGNGSFLNEVIASLDVERPAKLRTYACLCIRNLGRVPRMRALLEDGVPPLVQALRSSSELPGAAAAALCNVACSTSGKELAVKANAVQLILLALRSEENSQAAENMVACLRVLCNNYSIGAEAVIACDVGVRPLVDALARFDNPDVLAAITDTLVDLALALGPSGHFAPILVTDDKLVRQDLPRIVQHSAAEVRGGALKLIALLWEFSEFRNKFAAADGILALQAAADSEPPTVLLCPKVSTRSPIGTMGCANGCCLPGEMNRPPSRREIAEQLIEQYVSLHAS
eukprot:TRINITY_DN37848_c0_g1_i1.p1 TRINITY_DN37848_c0_g1~~TRINITY_DN37848_c0_g1_i1.p1  ORF type:complete len:393 (+),score=34.13 TRINITY_DN37848_c0_g1_i1:42-1181(+)